VRSHFYHSCHSVRADRAEQLLKLYDNSTKKLSLCNATHPGQRSQLRRWAAINQCMDVGESGLGWLCLCSPLTLQEPRGCPACQLCSRGRGEAAYRSALQGDLISQTHYCSSHGTILPGLSKLSVAMIRPSAFKLRTYCHRHIGAERLPLRLPVGGILAAWVSG
jgi:hypothetical protein